MCRTLVLLDVVVVGTLVIRRLTGKWRGQSP